MNKKSTFKKKIIIINIIVILLFIMVLGFLIYRKNIRSYNINATSVYMEVGNYHGNGSIIKMDKNEIVIVTTKHLLDEGNEVTITFFGGESVESNQVFVSNQHDIGFVKVPIMGLSEKTMQVIEAVKYKRSVYKHLKQENIMQYVYMDKEGLVEIEKGRIGNPSWYVEEFQDIMIYNYCKAKTGMSGSGAFTEDNYYIGMLIGGFENESVCLPLPVILEILKQQES